MLSGYLPSSRFVHLSDKVNTIDPLSVRAFEAKSSLLGI
jgi:hypothetical protein